MALVGNHSVLHKSPGRFLNGGVGILRSGFNKHGMARNAAFTDLSIPRGHKPPSAWVMSKVAGGMSSFNAAGLTISAGGLVVGGITTMSDAAISITTNTPAAQLISSGQGAASISLMTNAPLLTASIGGTGVAAISITTNTPTLGAEASGSGTATMTFAGSLTPYALGQMIGSTANTGVLTADSITAAVWNAILADFTTNGTAGKALASAGSGGVDLDALAQAILAAAQITPIHADVVLGQDSVADAVFAKVVP